MPTKPYDVTTKDLLRRDPASWMAYFHLDAAGPVEAIATDVSTVAAEADEVYRVSGRGAHLIHIEMQSRRQQQSGATAMAIQRAPGSKIQPASSEHRRFIAAGGRLSWTLRCPRASPSLPRPDRHVPLPGSSRSGAVCRAASCWVTRHVADGHPRRRAGRRGAPSSRTHRFSTDYGGAGA